MLQAFRRTAILPVFRLNDADRFEAVKKAIESDPRLTLEAKPEPRFYADQSETLSRFISILGLSISVIFSIGAVIGAMITMYASVASRTGEIGTLRALGFSRGAILIAFLVEALGLGLVGGIVGLAAASFMQVFTISTMNFQTFAELAFAFTLTPGIMAASIGFALAMGFVGGFLPAARAARLQIVDACARRESGGTVRHRTAIWGSTWLAIVPARRHVHSPRSPTVLRSQHCFWPRGASCAAARSTAHPCLDCRAGATFFGSTSSACTLPSATSRPAWLRSCSRRSCS
jgi:predicted lysophospholipase L1 biosynthesis ABC-type transport system permease subunit